MLAPHAHPIPPFRAASASLPLHCARGCASAVLPDAQTRPLSSSSARALPAHATGFLHRSLDDDYSSPKRFCTTPERQIVTHGFNSPVSPMALLLNEVDDPGHAPLASSRLQPMGLKLPQQLPPTPQPRPTLMDPQQGLASPSTPSRKNKPQRCSICKGSGHKSRTCKMNPARAAVGAPVDMASAMLSPSETNVLAHTMGQDASR